jgi:hypothetical protein
MTLSFIPINDGEQIQVFDGDDYYLGTLVKTGIPSTPDPEGRLFYGPWMFDGTDCLKMIGWPDIRDLSMKIEHLNTHWNWMKQNELDPNRFSSEGRLDSPENHLPVPQPVPDGSGQDLPPHGTSA